MSVVTPDRPQRYEQVEFDQSCLGRLQVGEAQSNPGGGDILVKHREEGIYILAAPHTESDADRLTAQVAVSALERELTGKYYEGMMETAMQAAQEAVTGNMPVEQQADLRTGVSVTAVKAYPVGANELGIAVGDMGHNAVSHASQQGKIGQLNPNAKTDQGNPVVGLNHPPLQTVQPFYTRFTLKGDELLIMRSGAAAGYTEYEYLTADEKTAAIQLTNLNEMAQALLGKSQRFANRSVMVLSLAVAAGQERGRGWRQRLFPKRNRRIGTNTLAAAGVAGNGMTSSRSRSDQRVPLVVQPGERQGSVIIDNDNERRRGSSLKKVAIIGGLALTGYLALKYGFDWGDDKGLDLWPLGDGDIRDGDRRGLDLNPLNGSNFLSDDTVTCARDLTPDVDIDVPDLPDAPDLPDPPDLPDTPAAPDPPVAPRPDDALEKTGILAGEGIVDKIHEVGHENAGFENFTGDLATQVYEDARDKFGGGALIDLPNHAGPDAYQVGNDWRLSAPDAEARWASPEVRAFIHERIRELATSR